MGIEGVSVEQDGPTSSSSSAPGSRQQQSNQRTGDGQSAAPSLAVYCWAMLLARIYDVLPLLCRRCGGPVKIIAFVTERESVRSILEYVGEPADPPPVSPV